MENLLKDLRFGARMLIKTPAFTIVAVLTLALGIGANSAMFTAVNAVMLKKLPVRQPDQLVIVGDPAGVHSFSSGTPRTDIWPYPVFQSLRDNSSDIFQDVYASADGGLVKLDLDGAKEAQPPRVRLVSGGYFSTLGIGAAAGRVFGKEIDAAVGSSPEIVISDGYWHKKFSADPNVTGKTLKLNGYPFTVVGVAQPGFFGEIIGRESDIFVPLTMQPQLMPGRDFIGKDAMQYSWLEIMGRAKPGVSLEQVQSRLSSWFKASVAGFTAGLSAGDRETYPTRTIEVHAGATGYSSIREQFSKALIVLLAIVGLVLLIACVNVANLLLSRVTARQKEIAVRLAMGAKPARIMQQLLTESLLLACTGGAVGLLLSRWIVQLLFGVALRSSVRRIPVDVSVDWRILGFTAAVCVFSAVLFGLAPAWRAVHAELLHALQMGTRGASHSRWNLGKVLVSGQIALSILVLFAAGLLLRTLQKMQSFDLGYDRSHLVSMRVDPSPAGYKGARITQLADSLAEKLRHVPGVESVTYSENGIFNGTESADGIIVPGYAPPKKRDRITWDDQVGPGYLSVTGIPLLRGRDIGAQDTAASQQVALVNEAFARHFFNGADPIGRSFGIEDEPKRQNVQIVGLVQDVHDHSVKGQVEARAYFPFSQASDDPVQFYYLVRSNSQPKALIDSLRKTVRETDAALAILSADTVEDLVGDSLGQESTLAQMSSYFAGLALLLAAIGLYGVLSYSVAGRTRELGIRIALGAQRTGVLWMVLREALLMVLLGIGIGIPAAIAGARALNSMLFGLSVADPVSLLISISVLGATALLAGFIPARRATKVDPMVALRYE